MTKINSKQKTILEHLISGPAIAAYVVAIISFLLSFYWPQINQKIFDRINLSTTIQPRSTVLIDGKNLNINIKAQIVNNTEAEIRSPEFNCYSIKSTFWSKLPFTDTRGKRIGVLNREPINDMAIEGTLPPNAFGAYDLYINVPMPNQIAEFRELWIENQYHLTYQDLLEKMDLPQIDLMITVQTNPLFEDEAVLHLFKK